MKVELKKLQAKVGTTFVYITHDQSEALVMSDYVAVMNKGRFEQIDTPQNLYNNPSTPFTAQFVGDNNSWSGRLTRLSGKIATIVTPGGNTFTVNAGETTFTPDSNVDLFLRPEAMLIEPDAAMDHLNRFKVIVKAILFDGANSRLLVTPLNSDQELIVGLPQNRQFDHIRPKDRIEIGWHEDSGICFPGQGEKP